MSTYAIYPKTFDELLHSAREQAARYTEGDPPPYSECVVMTAEAFFDMCAVVADLRRRVGVLERGEGPGRANTP